MLLRSVALVLAVTLPAAVAIQINPAFNYNYEIPGVCGRWKLGADAKHPPCRPIRSGGGGFLYEALSNTAAQLGPNVLAANEQITFSQDATSKKYNTFQAITAYFDDPPCFTRKKYCTNWNDATKTCPVGDVKDCPSYQNRMSALASCGAPSTATGRRRGVQVGTAPYCFGITCPPTSCMDEEFYPGCAAFGSKDQSQTWTGADKQVKSFAGGTKQMSVTLEGTVLNMFGKTAPSATSTDKYMSDQTCDILCPCKAVTPTGQTCTWALSSDSTKQFTCSEHQYNLWKRCQGCKKLHTGDWQCIDSQGIRNPNLEAEDSQGYPTDLLGAGKDSCYSTETPATKIACTTYKVPFRDPQSEQFSTPYTTAKPTAGSDTDKLPAMASDSYKAMPVRFDVTKITVLPSTAAQVTFLTTKCACGGSWTLNTARDVTTCTAANCHFFAAGGIFEDAKDLANCVKPAGSTKRCLFSQIYRHQELFMYVGRMQASMAEMMFSTVHGMGIYSLISTKPSCIKSETVAKKYFPNVAYASAESADAPRQFGVSVASMVVAAVASLMLLRDQ